MAMKLDRLWPIKERGSRPRTAPAAALAPTMIVWPSRHEVAIGSEVKEFFVAKPLSVQLLRSRPHLLGRHMEIFDGRANCCQGGDQFRCRGLR